MPGLTHIAKALNITKASQLLGYFEEIQEVIGEDKFMQFMTALKEQSDLEIDVGLTGKKLKAKGLTQDQSQKSFIFRQEAPKQEQYADDDVVPDSPMGYWGTPSSSDNESEDTEEVDVEVEVDDNIE